MNKTQEIIDLKNRLSKLEGAVFSKEEVQPKFKEWEAYKSIKGKLVVVCTEDGNKLKGYGLDPHNVWENIDWLSEVFSEKATPKETQEMLIKACEIWGGKDWENVKINRCLTNEFALGDGRCNIIIENDQIWNSNGCIMYKGKWAEKLEEYQDGDKYILSDKDNAFSVASFNKDTDSFISSDGEIWNKETWNNIVPYTPERLIELAEKF